MLQTLRIRNYALIDEVELDFAPGFNALTGETGAGKSILIGALNLVLGARASSDAVRKGAERASIEALFHLPRPSKRLQGLLDKHDIALDGGQLLLTRVIGADGRGKATAGGALTPIATLAAIGDELVDLHGQHEHQSLLRAERQLDLLDGFAGAAADAEAVAEKVRAFRRAERALHELERDDRDRARQIEFLRFEVEEINAAGLEPGEEEHCRERLNRITNAETIVNLTREACALLHDRDEGTAVDLAGQAARDLERLADIDPRFAPLAEQLNALHAGLQEIAIEARGLGEDLEFDAEELEGLNQRIAQIGALKRKYGGSVEEILAYRDRAAGELETHEHRDDRIAALRSESRALESQAREAAEKLSAKRKRAKAKLDKQVSAALQDLGMKGARFETELAPAELGARGIDKAAFLLAANPGEALKPLRQVASGGEISRIMLALKSVFAEADAIPALVFDEIDAGVGGAVARKVAHRLHHLARSHQVLCITHIPQIAALAHAHFHVSKHTSKGRTQTRVEAVRDDARVDEIARLLDGTVSAVSVEHARALLAER